MFTPKKIIIHCSDSEWGNAADIDKWHKGNGWDGIGYHFVITNGIKKPGQYSEDRNGLLEIGRPLDRQGAHCRGQNGDSIGICLIGRKNFSAYQFDTLEFLLSSLMEQYGIKPEDVRGHSSFCTKTCPNFNVYDFMNRRFTGGPTLKIYDKGEPTLKQLDKRVEVLEAIARGQGLEV